MGGNSYQGLVQKKGCKVVLDDHISGSMPVREHGLVRMGKKKALGSLQTLVCGILKKTHGVEFRMREKYIPNAPPPLHPTGHYVILNLLPHLPAEVALQLPRDNPGKFYLLRCGL